jgi:ethanolamine utilization protein EutQ (cupin superfamily)
MLRTLLPIAALAAVAIAGCTTQTTSEDSSGKFTGDQRLVANTIEDFESAASKGDQDQICRELLAKQLIADFAEQGGTCAKAVDGALKDTDSFGMTVESVSIADGKATARVKADRGKNDVMQTMTLVKEGPGWRISAFETG